MLCPRFPVFNCYVLLGQFRICLQPTFQPPLLLFFWGVVIKVHENFMVSLISAATGLCPHAINEQEGEQFMRNCTKCFHRESLAYTGDGLGTKIPLFHVNIMTKMEKTKVKEFTWTACCYGYCITQSIWEAQRISFPSQLFLWVWLSIYSYFYFFFMNSK